MKRIALVFCLTCLVPALAAGQEAERQKTGHAYVFFAPGVITSFSCRSCTESVLHVGGGGEGTFFKGLGIGGELGYLGLVHGMGEGLGLGSLNGLYIFRGRSHPKLDPFVTGGLSLAIGNGGASGAANFGGGIQYWFHPKVGLRVELRDYVPTESFSEHLFTVRIGIALR